ncbi:YnbE family lipoprotein [Hyphococcus luteus]|jgi:hypothetical protein|nr:YnbE family lipoprotein [Marinicaulis flavus]
MMRLKQWRLAVLASFAAPALLACTTVTLKGDKDEPIVVNLNVKIDQEVRVRLDREIEDLIADNPDIF